jgi:hypothetical protein
MEGGLLLSQPENLVNLIIVTVPSHLAPPGARQARPRVMHALGQRSAITSISVLATFEA